MKAMAEIEMIDNITEKAYQKHAWILLFAIGVLALLSSLPPIFGVDLDPERKELIVGMTMSELQDLNPRFVDLIIYTNRGFGMINLAWAILILAISTTAYRKRERWAWHTLWSLPAYFIAALVILYQLGLTRVEIFLLPLIIIVSLLGLLLPYRKFFPRK